MTQLGLLVRLDYPVWSSTSGILWSDLTDDLELLLRTGVKSAEAVGRDTRYQGREQVAYPGPSAVIGG